MLIRKKVLVFGSSLILFLFLSAVAAKAGTSFLPSPITAITNNHPVLSAPLNTAFTYQGHLTDNGALANGAHDFQFILYDAASGGAQLGSIVTMTDLQVTDGLFTAVLDFGEVFKGTAAWLEIGVREGTSNGTYTILTPRQPLTAAPYAQGLMPGAVINGDLSEPALTIANDSGSAIHISNADGDGIHINNAGLEGINIENATNNGFEVDNAGQDGLQVGTVGINGVHVVEAGNHGVRVGNAAVNGFHVNNAGQHGVAVANAVDSGMYVGHSDGDGLVICNTGTETGCPRNELNNGIEIGNADHYGVSVESAGYAGVFVNSAGSDGVFVNSAGFNGVRVNSAGSDGINIVNTGAAGVRVHYPDTNGFSVSDAGDSGIWVGDATNYAGYFNGDINVTGNCNGCLLATFGINSGHTALNPGDIVAVAGTQESPAANTEMLMQVQPAAAGQPLVGVVSGRAELHTSAEDGTTVLVSRAGKAAAPNDYVTVIIYGPVQLTTQEAFAVGERVTLAENGRVRPLQIVELNGVPLAEAAHTLGMTLEANDSDGDGLVWVLVNPH